MRMSSEFAFDHAKIINDGGYWICLKLSDFSAVQLVRVWISRMVQNSKYIMTLKKYTEKRSLSANAYAWSLMTEIGNVLRQDKEAIYMDMLKRYGQSVMVSLITEAVPQFKASVKYCEEAGTSVLNGKEFTHVKVYKGSSEFDKREMSILIDGIVDEAKTLGIETLTPAELERMKLDWTA